MKLFQTIILAAFICISAEAKESIPQEYVGVWRLITIIKDGEKKEMKDLHLTVIKANGDFSWVTNPEKIDDSPSIKISINEEGEMFSETPNGSILHMGVALIKNNELHLISANKLTRIHTRYKP